jgi:putative MFS transporter
MAMATTRTTALDYLDNVRLTRFHLKLFIGVALAQILDGFESAILSFTLPGISDSMHIGPGTLGTVASMQSVGLLAGALVAGNLGDRIGRRWPFTLSLIIYPLGALLSAVAPTWQILLIGRIISGIGMGGQWPIAFTLIAEYTPKRWRSWAMPGMMFMTGVGMVVTALVGVFIVVPHGWRIGMWVGVIPAVLAIWARFSSPESVRFLLAKGRVGEAHAIARGVARQAGDDVEFTDQAPPVVREAARREAAGQQALAEVLPGGRDLLRHFWPLLALTLVIFFFNVTGYGALTWVPSLLVQHGISTLGSFKIVLISNSVAPVISIVLSLLTIDLGAQRRYALAAIGIAGGLAFAAFGASFVFSWPLFWIVVPQIAFSVFYTSSNSYYYTLSTELFPTTVRSQAVAYATGLGRVGAIVGPQVLGLLLGTGMGENNVIFIFAIPMVVAGVIALACLRRPTRYMSLEHASALDTGEATAAPAAAESFSLPATDRERPA